MATALKCALLVACNIFSAFVALMFVFYATTFLNDFLFPDRFSTSISDGGQMVLRVLVALAEAAILFSFAYVGNRLIASVLFRRGKRIAAWATGLSFAVVSVVVVISALSIYRQGL